MTIKNKNYRCGHCGNDITSDNGYYTIYSNTYTNAYFGYIYICHHCLKPTFFDNDGTQVPGECPGKTFGESIFQNKLVYTLYNEARSCFSINAFTSCGMCCRKILMHIAVDQGAEKDKAFSYYVDFLDENNLIPSNCKEWVSLIRTKGNEANHDIIILNNEEANTLLQFIEILITLIYEMPYKANVIKKVNN